MNAGAAHLVGETDDSRDEQEQEEEGEGEGHDGTGKTLRSLA